MSVSFRQVHIDRFDPDSPVNNVPVVEDHGITLEDVRAAGQSVKSSLSSGNGPAALKVALENPPYGASDTVKEAALSNVMLVLSSLRVSEIDAAINALNSTEKIVLVKYLFKASGSSQGKLHGAAMLSWMERAFAFAGQGAIIKHMTDRRTV